MSMQTLELKIPPVGLAITWAAAMWFVSVWAPGFQVALSWRLLLAVTLAAVGVGIVLSGVVSFAHAKTTMNPLCPENASALVTSGVYRYTRNPMYLGFLAILIGWAVFLANGFSALLLPAFVFYMNRFQIGPEEKALLRRFGSGFSDYCNSVRRWL